MSKLARRVFASVWFAFLAVIPVAFYFLVLWRKTEQQDATFFWVYIGAPILLAGICGGLLGASILDPAKVKTPGEAMLRGFMVSLLSYVLFSIPLFLGVVKVAKDTAQVLPGWIMIFFTGLVVVGWLIALVGVAGGALLYFYRVMNARDKGRE